MVDDLTPKNCAVCGKMVVGHCRVDKWGQLFHNECEFMPCLNCGRATSLLELDVICVPVIFILVSESKLELASVRYCHSTDTVVGREYLERNE